MFVHWDFCIPVTSKVISGWVPTCDSGLSMWLYSVTPLGDQATSTMAQPPTQSHYPDTELTSPCPILVKLARRLGSNKYQLCKSLV